MVKYEGFLPLWQRSSGTVNGAYIPPELQKVTDESFIHAAIENFDQNEDTLDGKCTIHTLAMVVYQYLTQKLSLLAGKTKQNIRCYRVCYLNKPHKNPEPGLILSAIIS